jgi:CMP-N,N'-diacetyllegionaminic acid synthase
MRRDTPFVVGLIPARGGSKGIAEKNIAQLAGKPLIAYTIETARQSSYIDELVLSTDSSRIAKSAKKFGLETDAIRPASLSSDRAKTVDVVRYELKRLEKKWEKTIDLVVLLQPTSPLRTSQDIDEACSLFFKDKNSSSLISVYEAGDMHPRIMYRKQGRHLVPFFGEGGKVTRRQNLEHVYVRNGALYLFTPELALRHNRLVSERPLMYVMPRERSINIDNPFDLRIAECLIKS